MKGMVHMPDGTLKEVNKREFLTKRDGLDWLADAKSAGRKGEYVEPSRQRFGAYCAEIIDGMRIAPQTRASYVKNLRNHIEPYRSRNCRSARSPARGSRAITACLRGRAGRTSRQARACRRAP